MNRNYLRYFVLILALIVLITNGPGLLAELQALLQPHSHFVLILTLTAAAFGLEALKHG